MKRILSILAVLGALTLFAGTAQAEHCRYSGGGGGYYGGGGGGYYGGGGGGFYSGRSFRRAYSPYSFGSRRGLSYRNFGSRRGSGIYFGFGF